MILDKIIINKLINKIMGNIRMTWYFAGSEVKLNVRAWIEHDNSSLTNLRTFRLQKPLENYRGLAVERHFWSERGKLPVDKNKAALTPWTATKTKVERAKIIKSTVRDIQETSRSQALNEETGKAVEVITRCLHKVVLIRTILARITTKMISATLGLKIDYLNPA